MLTVLDEFTRQALAVVVRTKMGADDVLEALYPLLLRHGSPEYTRGTAATRLLNAGLTLAEIANYMGWSVRYAAQVIEYYATVSPSESEAVLAKLEAAVERENALYL